MLIFILILQLFFLKLIKQFNMELKQLVKQFIHQALVMEFMELEVIIINFMVMMVFNELEFIKAY